MILVLNELGGKNGIGLSRHRGKPAGRHEVPRRIREPPAERSSTRRTKSSKRICLDKETSHYKAAGRAEAGGTRLQRAVVHASDRSDPLHSSTTTQADRDRRCQAEALQGQPHQRRRDLCPTRSMTPKSQPSTRITSTIRRTRPGLSTCTDFPPRFVRR